MKLNRFFLATALALSLSATTSMAQEEMDAYQLNGFELSGSEYWPVYGTTPFKYPDDVLWGFKGEENDYGKPTPASDIAQKCARQAYDKLGALLESPTAELKKVKSLGATSRFFLWTNDNSKADPSNNMRPSRMWHWNSGPKDYSKGYWKWESTVTPDGKCLVPDLNQAKQELTKVINILSQPQQ